MAKIDIKMPVLRARCVVIVGKYEDIKKSIPFGLECFGPAEYMARTTYIYRDMAKDDLPFTVVIHSRSAAISVIAHEAVHAASMIQDAMGVLPDFDNDELSAYIVQYICELCEAKLRVYE